MKLIKLFRHFTFFQIDEHYEHKNILKRKQPQKKKKKQEEAQVEERIFMNPTDYMTIQLLIQYKNDFLSYDLSKDLESWTDELFDELKDAIKSHFNINKEFEIYDKNNEIELCDIDDIKDEYESCDIDDQFTNVLQLNVVVEDEMENNDDNKEENKKVEEDVLIQNGIEPFDKYPNLLQVIGIEQDSMNIKFDLRNASSTKIKYKLQNIHENDAKLSSKLTIIPNKTSIKKEDIDLEADTMYNFAVYDQNRQISNSVSISTPKTNFNPTKEFYKPSPPSIDTIQQFYDLKKENILILWDFPKLTFGDTIIYKITTSETNNNKQEITELPLKISVSCKNIKVTITTISIINNKRYESQPSQTIIINPSNSNELIKKIPHSALKQSQITDEKKQVDNIENNVKDTLLVGNLHPKVTQKMLITTFGEYGAIDSIVMKRKGMALVKYKDPKKANIAKLVMNGRKLNGRVMGIGWKTAEFATPAQDKFSFLLDFFLFYLGSIVFFELIKKEKKFAR